jgi:hypothetical protein
VIAARTPQGTLWVCDGCLFAREADGIDGCGCTPACEPWSREPDTDITYGIICETPDHFNSDPDAHSEQCETRDFSWGTCDGCGCSLGGTRHAYTWWADGTVTE